MLKIDNIESFIKFLIELFNDEFDYAIDYADASDYFMYGGCSDLARIVHHFFPDTKYALKNDNTHIGILNNGKIYDALCIYDEETLKEMNLPSWATDKNLEHFNYFDSYDDLLKNASVNFGNSVTIEGKTVVNALIDEINNIGSIKVGKNL